MNEPLSFKSIVEHVKTVTEFKPRVVSYTGLRQSMHPNTPKEKTTTFVPPFPRLTQINKSILYIRKTSPDSPIIKRTIPNYIKLKLSDLPST